jgi:YVTN family beta-propeller protein
MNKLTASILVLAASLHAEPLPTVTRQPGEDVNSAALRTRQGLTSGPNLLFNGWGVSPAGQHVDCGDLALKILIAPDKKAAIAVCAGYNRQGVNVVSPDAGHETQFITMKEAFNGLAFSPDGKKFYVSGGDSGVITIFNYADGKASLDREVKLTADNGHIFLAGIAVHPSTGALYVCNEANHEVWMLNPDTLAREQVIAVGQHPHSCAVGGDGKHLYVSNWGSRSVSVIDMAKGARLRDITVGVRPNDMALAPDGRLFVACSGDNSVHVITTGKLEKTGPDASPARPLWAGTREIISTSLYPQSPEGSTPCGVAVSADGRTLFVANADNNDVMVVDISGDLMDDAQERGELIALVNGFIPTGWYPSAVCPTPDGQFLIVANGKGLTSRASAPPRSKSPTKLHTGILFDHPGRTFEGSLSFIAKPDAKQMAAYTEQVRKNSPYHPEHFAKAALPGDTVIPAKVGDPCPIKYVLYIIKENRTYDQVMGDMTDKRRQAHRQRRPEDHDVRRERHAQPASDRARLRAARQSVLQQRGERGRP